MQNIYIYIFCITRRRERGRVLHTSDIFIHIIHTSSSLLMYICIIYVKKKRAAFLAGKLVVRVRLPSDRS